MKKDNKLIGAGLLTAFAASLCCITPVLALIAGTSGLASSFSWLEPFRPYLIGLTILVLGFAWYQKLKPKKEIDCDCETDEKPKFILLPPGRANKFSNKINLKSKWAKYGPNGVTKCFSDQQTS